MHSNRPAAAWGGQLLVHHRRIRRRRRRRRRLWQRICGSGAASTRSVASPYIVKLISFCCYSCCFALRPRNRNAPRSIRPFFFQEGQNLSVLFFFWGGGGRGTPASNPLSFTRILERIGVGALWMEFDWMRGNVEMRRRSHQDPSPSHLFHRNQRISTHHWNPTEWLVKFFDWVVMGWYWGSLHVVVGKDYTVFFCQISVCLDSKVLGFHDISGVGVKLSVLLLWGFSLLVSGFNDFSIGDLAELVLKKNIYTWTIYHMDRNYLDFTGVEVRDGPSTVQDEETGLDSVTPRPRIIQSNWLFFFFVIHSTPAPSPSTPFTWPHLPSMLGSANEDPYRWVSGFGCFTGFFFLLGFHWSGVVA